jgi:hypothetical protein
MDDCGRIDKHFSLLKGVGDDFRWLNGRELISGRQQRHPAAKGGGCRR